MTPSLSSYSLLHAICEEGAGVKMFDGRELIFCQMLVWCETQQTAAIMVIHKGHLQIMSNF